MKQLSNEFKISGIVASDAEVKNFTNASLARFPLAVSRIDTTGEEPTRVTAYLQIEMWCRGENANSFELLKRGAHLTATGYLRPESWVAEDGSKRSRITFIANKIEPTPEKDDAKKE
jgi:single-strand DNA-binding protein